MSTATLPTDIDGLSDGWLTEALRRSGRLGAAESVRIEAREPLTTGTSFATRMYRLRLSGAPSAPASAIVKLPVTGPLRAFLDGIRAYAREVAFYRDLAPELPIRAPECYIAEQASDSTDFVLAIEDLTDAVPGDSLTGLTLAQAELAADTLASLHGWAWEHERLDELSAFPRLDGELGRRTCALIGEMFAATWPGVTDAYELDDALVRFGQRLPELIPWFIDQLATPRTIAHGELRADNLFIGDGTLTLIDFQTVCQQSGLIDVSYLFSQSLPLEVRRAHEADLLHRYHAGLRAAGVTGYSLEDATRQYRIGVAFNLVWACLMHGQLASLDDRGRALVYATLSRAFHAIDDNRSLELIP